MRPRFVSLLLLTTICCSCEQIKHNSSQAQDAEINKVRSSQDNQQLFAQRFQHVRGTNIKVYKDYVGSGYKELFSFTCSPADMMKIVADKQMKPAPAPEEGLLLGEDITWWDKKKMSGIRPYKAGKDYEDRQYLWYDTATMQTWYLVFSQ